LLFSTTTGHPMNEAPRKTSIYETQLPANIPTQSPYCKPDSRSDLAIVLLRWKSSRYVLRSFCHGKTSAVRSPKISAWISASAPRVTVQRGWSVDPDMYDEVCDISLFLARLVSVSDGTNSCGTAFTVKVRKGNGHDLSRHRGRYTYNR
jgi:hypothetical protein